VPSTIRKDLPIQEFVCRARRFQDRLRVRIIGVVCRRGDATVEADYVVKVDRLCFEIKPDSLAWEILPRGDGNLEDIVGVHIEFYAESV